MRLVVVLLLVSFAVACSDRKPDRQRSAAPNPTTTHATTPPRPADARNAARIDRDAAVALIGRWLDAQNQGDFEAYQALYAPTFTGVKRTTRRTKHFDRTGWLADRARMFRRPMQVTATGIDVRPQGDGASVSFVQRWASGSYADEGRKQMHLVRVDGKPAIRFEELLGYPGAMYVRGAFDLEGDGTPEVVATARDGEELWLVRLGPHPGVLRRFMITMEVCDC